MTDRVLHLYVKFLELQKAQTSNDTKQCNESLEKTVPADIPRNTIICWRDCISDYV